MKSVVVLFSCLLLSACYNKPQTTQTETFIVTDYGLYDALSEAKYCEESIDWSDKNTLDDTQCTQAFAAQELQAYLRKITAPQSGFNVTKFNAFQPDKKILSGNKIIIANIRHIDAYRDYALHKHIKGITLKPQGYLIKSYKEAGNTHLLILGADRVGTLYGVYGYLESLGIRWYGLGDENEELPKAQDFVIREINLVDHPAFITRGFWAKDDRGHTDFFNWMARNRINLWSYAQPERAALKKRGINFLTGGHQIQQRFLDPQSVYPYKHILYKRHEPKTHELESHEHKAHDPYPHSSLYKGDANNDGVLSYYEAHPEWFGLINGRRSSDNRNKYGTNFCSSNKHAVKELTDNFINDLVEGKWSQADMVNFWPRDVGKWCECDQCQLLGSATDRLLKLQHQVRQGINKATVEGRLNRNVILTAPAYLETRDPPSRALPENFDYKNNIMTFFPIERCYAHALNDETCTNINHHHVTDMQSWLSGDDRFYKGTLFLGEYYNISLLASLPMIFTKVMSEDLPFYYQSGIRHMHYMHAETINWGTMLLTNYQFSKMLWNPEVDVNALMTELYERFYGANAAQLMQRFYQNLELAMSSMKTIRWAGKSLADSYSLDDRLKKDKVNLFTTQHLKYKATTSSENDGRDILQIVEDIKQARKHLDKAKMLVKDKKYLKRIQEVEKRFAYGEAIIHFYDHLIKIHIAHHASDHKLAKREFQKTALLVEKLKSMTDVIQVVGGTLKAGDGFTATFNKETFERYKNIYHDNK